MNDDRLLDEALRALPPPPEAPRERMWARVAAARCGTSGNARLRSRRPRPGRWQWPAAGAALAAMLVLGFALGRWTEGPAPSGDHAQRGGDADRATAAPASRLADRRADGYRRAATQLFDRAEVLLAGFQAEAARTDAAITREATADWAAGLLAQTRLLLDSPAADDADARRLLRELELVLARIASLPAGDDAGEAARIAEDLSERATLQRLRLAGAL